MHFIDGLEDTRLGTHQGSMSKSLVLSGTQCTATAERETTIMSPGKDVAQRSCGPVLSQSRN